MPVFIIRSVPSPLINKLKIQLSRSSQEIVWFFIRYIGSAVDGCQTDQIVREIKYSASITLAPSYSTNRRVTVVVVVSRLLR